MIFQIRIILDSKKDVLRDIEILANNTFEDLHKAIINCFDLRGNEMASFYLSDEKWKQNEEIILDSFFEDNSQMLMKETYLSSIVSESQKKFIYIYDFLNLWTFYIDIFEIKDQKKGDIYPKYIFSKGNLPDEAPKKTFIADKNNDDFNDEELNYNNFY
tara:strand:+ start:136 stop:612 length:477 start_codon:yes stop_codon:yes gene_type:complete